MSDRDAAALVAIDDALATLMALIGPDRVADDAPLADKIRWLEQVTAVGARALRGDVAERALTDLRAALGAVVAWGRGPRTPEKLVELELVMRALIARGSVGLLQAVAADLRTLAAAGNCVDACRTAAAAFDEAAGALRDGGVIANSTMVAMRAVTRGAGG